MLFRQLICLQFFMIASLARNNCKEDDVFPGIVQQMNAELLNLNAISAQYEWLSVVKPSEAILKVRKKISGIKIKWRALWCDKLRTYCPATRTPEEKMIILLCRGPQYSVHEGKVLTSIFDRLLLNYETKEICQLNRINDKKCYKGENEVKRLMESTRDENMLFWAWTKWREDTGQAKNLFIHAVNLQNVAARRNGELFVLLEAYNCPQQR